MGRPWRRIRARKLQTDPLCERCLKNGRTTSATEVHHVTPRSLGGDHSPSNLMSICTPCHDELGMPRRVRTDGIAVLEDGTVENASSALMGATAVTAAQMTVELATTGQGGSRNQDRLGGWESWHDRRVSGFPKAVDYDDPDVDPETPNNPATPEGNPAIEWQVSGTSGASQAKDYFGVRLTNGAPTDSSGDATRVIYVVSPYPSTDRLNAAATYTVTPTVVLVAA